MPRAARIFETTFSVMRGWTALARVENPSNGAVTQQADLTGIKYTVTREDGTVTKNAVTVAVATAISNTLKTDNRWKEDPTGFNFEFEIPADAFPASDHYRVEFVFDPVIGEDFSLIYEGGTVSTVG